jgi:hypothetical protein
LWALLALVAFLPLRPGGAGRASGDSGNEVVEAVELVAEFRRGHLRASGGKCGIEWHNFFVTADSRRYTQMNLPIGVHPRSSAVSFRVRERRFPAWD